MESEGMMRCLVAVLTNDQLMTLHQMTIAEKHARGMSEPVAKAITPVVVDDDGGKSKSNGWSAVPKNVKTAPTKNQIVATRKAVLNKLAGPMSDDEDSVMYYRCCTNEKCSGKVYVSYCDIDEEMSCGDDTYYVEKTMLEIQKTMDTSALFVHGLLGSDDYQIGRGEILMALKGVIPKNTRVKPGDEFGFVYFENHSTAVKAQRNLTEQGYKANFLRKEGKK